MAERSTPGDIDAETLRVFTDSAAPAAPRTTPEVAAELDCGRRATYERLQSLADRGQLRTKKVGAGGRIWWRPVETDSPDRRRLRELLTNAERLGDVVLPGADVDDDELFWTDGTCRIHGVDSEYDPTLEAAIEFYHPEDRETIRSLFDTCVETGAPYSLEARLVTAADEKRWVRVSAEAITEADHSKVRGYLQDITAQKQHRRVLERQRSNLEVLNSLNVVVRQLTDAVIDKSTRAEIEATTCAQLADSDPYRFAWLASIDPVTLEFIERAEHGSDGYLAEAQLTANPTEPGGKGPAGRAARTKEMQLSQNVFADPHFEPWQDLAERYGYRSMAAIPIVYEETIYGVLGIYSERVGAFSEPEREVLAGISEIVGHAIASVERKQALLSDEVVELSFRLDRADARVDFPPEFEADIEFDSTLPLGDGVFLVYCTATGVSQAAVRHLEEHEGLRFVEDITVVGTVNGGLRLEVRLVDPPVLSAVTNNGGYVSAVTVDDAGLSMTVTIAADQDVPAAIDRITGAEPEMELLRRRQTSRIDRSLDRVQRTVFDSLTDRQRAALDAAYFMGYFDWPREASGPEVADSLGVSASTFHQHLRKAERKLLEAVYS